jgi:hypothetical protein
VADFPEARPPLVGLIRLRDHCTFSWEEPAPGGPRRAEVRATHCPACVAELRTKGYVIVREGLLGDDAE